MQQMKIMSNDMAIEFVLLLLHIPTFSGNQESVSISCPDSSPCKIALASNNPVTLKCGNNSRVYWQHINAANPNAQPITFIQSSGSLIPSEDLKSHLQLLITSPANCSELLGGDLRVLDPRVNNTGVYICKDRQKILAYYEIDFQDARHIYISHASLGENVHLNTIVDLGDDGIIEMHTQWSNWQPCNRCGWLGERKRTGFCYAEISKDAVLIGRPLPCGLLKYAFKEVQFNHPMELQIEICQEECNNSLTVEEEEDSQIEKLGIYKTIPYSDSQLKCPMTSIYRPVYWQHRGKPITWRQQLKGKSSYLLDTITGGGTLFIPLLTGKDNGSYSCYVDQKLAKRFQITFQWEVDDDDDEDTLGVKEYALIGLGAFFFLTLVMAIYQVFREGSTRITRIFWSALCHIF